MAAAALRLRNRLDAPQRPGADQGEKRGRPSRKNAAKLTMTMASSSERGDDPSDPADAI